MKVHSSQRFFMLMSVFLTNSSVQVTSSSLAFFTERRIYSLSQRLGNNRLNDLVETIESVIRSRLLAQGPSSISLVTFKKPSDIEQVPLEKAKSYINCRYLPFLDLVGSLCC